jgi:hypothetical protein
MTAGFKALHFLTTTTPSLGGLWGLSAPHGTRLEGASGTARGQRVGGLSETGTPKYQRSLLHLSIGCHSHRYNICIGYRANRPLNGPLVKR